MKYGSVCSGIEAATVAWDPLGWKPAWFAEIEPFPCAVLAHHYPDTPNLGDMTALPDRIASGDVDAPDIFCGGTPCQAFSVAGLRRSLDDARGNLSLVFCEIANAIDSVRAARGEQPTIVFWENVPGVLNTKDNAFGCFLAGLAGEDDPLIPAGDKWSNAGYVLGPQRAVAWRVTDAQYFGVAQRRRRVFVVASAREGFDPASVLFEFEGVRRDTPPSREAREVAPTIPARSSGGGGLGTDFDCDGGVITMAHGQGGFDRGPTLTRNHEAPIAAYAIQAGALRTNPASGPDGVGVQEGHAYTLEARAEVQAVCVTGSVTHTLKAEGFDASEDGTGRGVPVVPTLYSNMPMNSGRDYKARKVEVAQPLMAGGPVGGNQGGDVILQPIAVHGTQDPCTSTDTVFALGRNSGQENAIAFSCKDYGADAGELSPTLRAMGHGESHANAGGQVAVALPFDTTQITSPLNYSNPNYGDPCHPLAAGAHVPAIAVSLRGREGGATAELGDEVGNCLRASSGGGDKAHVLAPVAYSTKLHNTGSNNAGKIFEERTTCLDANSPPPALLTAMQVRRLTPVECERLQGFPDSYTMIPWRKKPAEECPDGPRYKALGNSWAVPNVRWIGRRIWDEVYFPRESK